VERSDASGENLNNNNNNYCKTQDTTTASVHPSIEALAAACGEKILNPDFLLQGDGEPFVGSDREAVEATVAISKASIVTLSKICPYFKDPSLLTTFVEILFLRRLTLKYDR